MPSTLEKAYQRTLQQTDQYITLAADDALLTQKIDRISHWTIAQHIEHLVIVNREILAALNAGLLKPPTEPTPGRVSLLGYLVLWTGFIPRGRGKAPTMTLPKTVSPETLRRDLATLRTALSALAPHLPAIAASRARAPHPVLGMFTAAHWIRFIPIHNHHHDKIIREIRNT